MPAKITSPPEEKIRQYVVDNVRPAEIYGYDPQETDTQSTAFIPVTSDWSLFGQHYPSIYVSEDSAATLPGSGTTNSNGKQGDGSGNNQYAIHSINVAVQTKQGGGYLTGVDFDDLAYAIFWEIAYQIRQDTEGDSESIFQGQVTPPFPQRENESTETTLRLTGTAPVGIQYTP